MPDAVVTTRLLGLAWETAMVAHAGLFRRTTLGLQYPSCGMLPSGYYSA